MVRSACRGPRTTGGPFLGSQSVKCRPVTVTVTLETRERVMQPKPHGNGSGKINIHQADMGGWVRVFTDDTTVVPADFPVYLSHALTEWFRQRPQLRMRSVVVVVRDG